MTDRTMPLAPLLLLALLAGVLPGQATQAPPRERVIMGTVAALLEEAHIAHQPLDDEVSRHAFDAYFEALDPFKLYFYATDIANFSRQATELDDMLKAGSATFAVEVFERFKKRVGERVAVVDELLKGEFEFTVDESFVTDRKAVSYPRDEAEARDRWRLRIKSNILALRVAAVPEDEIRQRLSRRYQRFVEQVSQEVREDVLARFINAITTCYDPHTNYMSPRAFQNFNMALTLNYQGIGALLGDDDGEVVIRRVMPGGAVERDGSIKANDHIVAVAQGKDGPFVDIVGMRLDEVVDLIRGEGGTVVRLSIRPTGGGGVRTVELTRARIELEDQDAKGEIYEHGIGADGKPRLVGVIDLPSFYRDSGAASAGDQTFKSSTRDIERILQDFKQKGVESVVLDLRRNGGGFLPEAVGVAGLFVDRGPMVQVKAGPRRVRQLDDPEPGRAWDGPLVVLTSRNSASASEIVAGAVQDYRRGLVVGDSATHGKGTVQTPIDLAEAIDFPGGPGSLGVLKVTIQKFYRPSGRSTQLRGVGADIELPSMTDRPELGEGELPYALPYDRISPSRFRDEDRFDSDMVGVLREASRTRQKASTWFRGFRERLDAYRRFRDTAGIPLEEQAYRKLQAALEGEIEDQDAAEPEEAPAVSEAPAGEKPKPGPWLSEVLSIALEYADLLQHRQV